MVSKEVLKKSATPSIEADVPLLGQAARRFRERAVTGALRPYFSSIWIHQAEDMPRAAAIVPDACADLVFADGGLHIAGPDRHVNIHTPRPGRVVVGLRFQPGGVASLLRTSCAQLVGVRPRLECFWGNDARHLEDRLGETTAPEETAQRLEAALVRRVTTIDSPDQTPLALFQLVGRTDGTSVVRRLTRYFGLSERTIRRQCIDAFGFGPKTLDRILRFQRFLALLHPRRSSEMAWLAASAGYSDQAHLTREARCLAGVTPSVARAQLLERATTRAPSTSRSPLHVLKIAE